MLEKIKIKDPRRRRGRSEGKKKGRKEEKRRKGGETSRSLWRLAHATVCSVSKEYPLLRPVMSRLHAKGPMKDIRRRIVKAKNVCVILEGSRRF